MSTTSVATIRCEQCSQIDLKLSLALENLAQNAIKTEDYASAVEWYETKQNIDAKLNILEPGGDLLVDLGYSYQMTNNNEKAKKTYQRALDAKKEVDDKSGLAKIHSNLGALYLSESALKQAFEHFQDSLSLWQSLNETEGIISCKNNLGIIAENRENYTRAIPLYEYCVAEYFDLEDYTRTYQALSNLIRVSNKASTSGPVTSWCTRLINHLYNHNEVDGELTSSDFRYIGAKITARPRTERILDAFSAGCHFVLQDREAKAIDSLLLAWKLRSELDTAHEATKEIALAGLFINIQSELCLSEPKVSIEETESYLKRVDEGFHPETSTLLDMQPYNYELSLSVRDADPESCSDPIGTRELEREVSRHLLGKLD